MHKVVIYSCLSNLITAFLPAMQRPFIETTQTSRAEKWTKKKNHSAMTSGQKLLFYLDI